MISLLGRDNEHNYVNYHDSHPMIDPMAELFLGNAPQERKSNSTNDVSISSRSNENKLTKLESLAHRIADNTEGSCLPACLKQLISVSGCPLIAGYAVCSVI